MIKAIAFIRRKAGVSREEFARHYEAIHAPLGMRLIPSMRGYTRNHVLSALGSDVDFDCITTFWYDSLEAALDVVNFAQSDAGKPLRDDEATFMDSSKTVSIVVEERVTLPPPTPGRESLVKAVALLKRKAGLTREEFIDHYEQVHAPLIVRITPGLVGYARNYVVTPPGGDLDFDSMTELWHQDQAAFNAVLRSGDTKGGRERQRDEATFLDTQRIIFLHVQERVSITYRRE